MNHLNFFFESISREQTTNNVLFAGTQFDICISFVDNVSQKKYEANVCN